MSLDTDLLARVIPFREGRAYPRASHLQFAIKSDAMVLAPLAMAGEDTTVQIIAFGRLGMPARVLFTPDPRMRDDQFRMFELLSADIEAYYNECREAESFPQLLVSSTPVARHLDTLAESPTRSSPGPLVTEP